MSKSNTDRSSVNDETLSTVGKAKIGEHEIDLKKATPKSDPYFGAGYSDFYGYDSAVQTEEKKVRNRQVRICQLKMQKE